MSLKKHHIFSSLLMLQSLPSLKALNFEEIFHTEKSTENNVLFSVAVWTEQQNNKCNILLGNNILYLSISLYVRTKSHNNGVQAITTALKYLEQTSNVTLIDLKFSEKLAKKSGVIVQWMTDRKSSLFQWKIMDF